MVLKAFKACAASQGDCNNLTFGFGGNQSGQEEVRGFGYYETIAGGSGAGPTWEGSSGVHTHMTNTRITDAEVFERRYPVILREFGLRKGSGGDGQHRGGDGVVRDIQFRIPVSVSILSERRVYHPYGLEGGEDGQCGLNVWVRRSSGADRDGIRYQRVSLGGKNTAHMQEGERIIVITPGGGGWGPPGKRSNLSLKNDPKLSWRKGSVALRQDTAEASA